MDVKKCSIEATVPTGFEPTAREEAEEKLGVTATYERGKICFDISLDDMAKVYPIIAHMPRAFKYVSVYCLNSACK